MLNPQHCCYIPDIHDYLTTIFHDNKTGQETRCQYCFRLCKNDEILDGEANQNLSLLSITFDKTGEYICYITNPELPGLTLNHQPFNVNVIVDLEKEKAVLLDLYNSTDGGNWKDNTNWNSKKPCECTSELA